MNDDEEDVHNLRQSIVQGVVLSIEDGGAVQTATVQTADGAIRAGVEIVQPFGFASSPPAAGADVLLWAVGGDVGHLVGLVSAPGLRFGNLNRGEVVVYGAGGSRVHLQQGGTVVIAAATKVIISATAVEIDGALTVNGHLQVNGAIDATGTIHGH